MSNKCKKFLAAMLFIGLGVIGSIFVIYLVVMGEAEFHSRSGPIRISLDNNPWEFWFYIGCFLIGSMGAFVLGGIGLFRTFLRKTQKANSAKE